MKTLSPCVIFLFLLIYEGCNNFSGCLFSYSLYLGCSIAGSEI